MSVGNEPNPPPEPAPQEPAEIERKLTAILVADVVGFSTLAHVDEEPTVKRLRALRSDLIVPTVARHYGRVVKSTGDGAIVEFRSAVEAVRCAIELQNAMPGRNLGVPEDKHIVFRIGIHVGDVVEEADGDLMGDGVNIAARLEGVARHGGICLSVDAYRQVDRNVKEQFQNLGEIPLKNIPRPMRVYAWGSGPGGPAPPPKPAQGEATKPAPASNIPITVPRHFLGRDDAIEAIDAVLKRGEGTVAITALHGLRGVGKTTLAAAYAERRSADYRATWWIRAQTPDTMRADLVSLGVRLGWIPADAKEAEALERVRERLRHEGGGILLVYDSAIDAASLRPFLPRGGAARALITSNAHAWREVAAPVEIRIWPRQIGADYLIARTGRDKERAEAEALSETLGGLPLAHEQAAAYCEQLEISLSEYRRRFDAAPSRLLDDVRHAPAEYRDGLTVTKTFALAIEEAAKLHPAAEPLVFHAALLAPEPIPLYLFSEGREAFGEPLASQLVDDGLDEAIAALRALALVDRETIADERDPAIVTETIRLHRLVREVAARRREGEAVEAAQRVLLEAMAAVYPSGAYNDPSAWPRARRLDALALDLVASPDPPPGRGRDDQLSPAWARLVQATGAGGLCGRAAALRARAGDRREGARPRASPDRHEPQQPRWPASGPGRPRRRAAALRAGAGDPREGARPRASRHRHEPQQPRPPASGPGRPRRRAAALRAGAGDHGEGARPRASLDRHEPQQPRAPASGPGRPRRRAAALRAGAGDLREGARPRASLDRHEPQQPRAPASGPGRPRRRAAALRAGAGDLREGARPRASRYRDEPQQPRPPA